MSQFETVSCRIIRSCLDYANSKNIDLEEIISRYSYSYELIEDSYNWVAVSFLNEIISKIEKESGKNNVAFEIGTDSASRNSWGDIENVIKAIGTAKPILAHVEKFTAYFLKTPVILMDDSDASSVTIRSTDQTGEYSNAVEFILGAMISIPRLWGGNDLSAVRFRDRTIRINFSEDPSFFDTNNDYKKFSPKLLEEIILGLEKTKKIIEYKNSELEKKNKELEKAYKDLEQNVSSKIQNEKMATIGTLSAGIAHEINNPLSFVISNFRSLKRYFDLLIDPACENPKLPADVLMDIPAMLGETEEGLLRVKKLVEDINYLAHPGTGDKSLVDIKDIIDSAIRLTGNAHKSSVTIKEDYRHKRRIMCTPSKISQVLVNVLLNSIHAVRSTASGRGEITFSTIEQGNNLEIVVVDNGVGISKENIVRVFEPFFTTKKAGEGTGLGLSTSQSIIASHKGTMELQSQPNTGTRVVIRLPLSETAGSELSLF
jgi:two-component system NtrC family sensor kinase